MRVLFNTTAALDGTSGFTQTVELMAALRQVPSAHEFVILSTRTQARLREALGTGVSHLVVDTPAGGLGRTAALLARLPGLVARAGADALYNRGNFYAPRIRACQICLIENANPFSPLTLPVPAGLRARNRLLRVMSDAALSEAAAVVFPSETARRSIVRGRTIGARPFVIPHGAEMRESPAGAAAQARPYLLAVTSLFPFKNLSVAIRALGLLRARGAFTGRLVIVGDHGPVSYVRDLRREIDSLGLADAVEIHEAVPRAALPPLYRNADVALTTSLEETFGLPVVEAMGLGAPVVAPDAVDGYFIPFRELCGDAAEYFDPFNADACAAAIERALRGPRRAAMIERGYERARHYTWERAARLTADMLTVLDASRNCSDNGPRGTRETSR